MTTSTRIKSEDQLLNDLIQLMESNELPPWRKPWTATNGVHRNLITAQEYRGCNPLMLELGLLMRGLTLPLWCGGGQAKQKGWHPRKGCKAVRILRPQLNQRGRTDTDGSPVLDSSGNAVVSAWVSYKPVCVFNAADLKGSTEQAQASLDALIAEQTTPANAVAATESERVTTAELHIEQWPVPVNWGGTIACYSSNADRISMPSKQAFDNTKVRLATWLHEQAHSSGHQSRLNRPLGNRFGSKAYALEELTAELASVLACYRLSIGYEIQQHAAYLKSWAQVLKDGGSKQMLKILSDARAAADLIAPENNADEETAMQAEHI